MAANKSSQERDSHQESAVVLASLIKKKKRRFESNTSHTNQSDRTSKLEAVCDTRSMLKILCVSAVHSLKD